MGPAWGHRSGRPSGCLEGSPARTCHAFTRATNIPFTLTRRLSRNNMITVTGLSWDESRGAISVLLHHHIGLLEEIWASRFIFVKHSRCRCTSKEEKTHDFPVNFRILWPHPLRPVNSVWYSNKANGRGELTAGYRWSGWVWEITGLGFKFPGKIYILTNLKEFGENIPCFW